MSQPHSTFMVATDLSRFSGYAIGRAQIMADEQDAQIEIVHCLPDSLLQTLKDNLLGNHEQSQRALLSHHTKLLNRSTKRLLGANLARVSTQLLQGDPDDILPDHADTIGARLVLLGAHGKGFVKSLLIGSITSRLVRTLRQPALVVKTPARSPYSNVLIAVDFSPASLQAIAISRQAAPSAHLTLVHLYDVPFAGMLRYAGIKSPDIAQYRHEIHAKSDQNLHTLAQQSGLDPSNYTAISVEGGSANALLNLQTTLKTDLIVLGKHGRHLKHEFLIGSVTQTILARSKSDVLVTVNTKLPQA